MGGETTCQFVIWNAQGPRAQKRCSNGMLVGEIKCESAKLTVQMGAFDIVSTAWLGLRLRAE